LAGLERILKNGQFSHQPTVEELKRSYIKHSDSLKAFVEECIEVDVNGTIGKDEFHSTYSTYCREKGLIPKDKLLVGRKLSEIIPVETAHPRKGEERVRSWKGISFREDLAQVAQPAHDNASLKQHFADKLCLSKEKSRATRATCAAYKILKSVPPFKGINDKLYGGWKEGDIVEIPEEEAEPLINDKYIQKVD
jgi:phage/plasmid-associated DNA primase